MQKKKIVHICLCGIVTDGMTYQDNLLPKYHQRIGYDVTVITSKWVYDTNGQAVLTDKNKYSNEYNVNMIRIPIKGNKPFSYRLKRYENLYYVIEQEQPDILFIHGCQFMDMNIVKKYVKNHKDVVVYVDNHADYSNSATTFLSKYILHGILWRRQAQLIDPYVKNWYGVLPARVEFLQERYGISQEKIKLLVMGIDDDFVQMATSQTSVSEIRTKYQLDKEDFILITGGKIDKYKTQTLTLMKVFHTFNDAKLKLLVFGSIESDLQDEFNRLLNQDKRIKYIGWLSGSDIYKYLGCADLAVYPGRHSVLWEQTVGLGIPAIFKRWNGTTHVDVGGNCCFLDADTEECMRMILKSVLNDHEKYTNMKKIAVERGMHVFSYENIARMSLR